MTRFFALPLILLCALAACGGSNGGSAAEKAPDLMDVPEDASTLVVAGGCFWCVEKDFEARADVYEAVSGFAGGDKRDATSRDHEGHREAVEVYYDASQTSFAELIYFFLRTIDVTDAGGQFCDRGHAYTTAIYYKSEAERAAAEAAIAEAEKLLGKEIATRVEPLPFFVAAEDYHQDYYKSDEQILTRYGRLPKSEAYKRYRKGCGRDARVRAVWGDEAATH